MASLIGIFSVFPLVLWLKVGLFVYSFKGSMHYCILSQFPFYYFSSDLYFLLPPIHFQNWVFLVYLRLWKVLIRFWLEIILIFYVDLYSYKLSPLLFIIPHMFLLRYLINSLRMSCNVVWTNSDSTSHSTASQIYHPYHHLLSPTNFMALCRASHWSTFDLPPLVALLNKTDCLFPLLPLPSPPSPF